jgi:demethylmenaquinone methyltransferase/2-methoxy-6-polyprenyl-1,4-benzoquinol methylase
MFVNYIFMIKKTKTTYQPVSNMNKHSRVKAVQHIFATVVPTYDLLNRVLSMGMDLYWRKTLVSRIRFFKTGRFLDVATGTADLAIETAISYPKTHTTGIDFVSQMLEKARKKIEEKKLSDRIDLARADATNLPFPSNYFDTAAIAFGIRNIPDIKTALSEMLRVIAPGGRILVLEMHLPDYPAFQHIARLYLKTALPWLARCLSPNPAAYTYLADSIIHFPSPKQFRKLMKESGMIHVNSQPLSMGITWLHQGTRPL